MEQGNWWQNKKGFIRGSWKWFWTLNILVLVLATWQDSKRSRIKVMDYLYEQGDATAFVIGASHREGGMLLPRYYLGRYATYYHVTGQKPFDQTERRVARAKPEDKPNYIIFSKKPDEDLAPRLAVMQEAWPNIVYDTTITGSWLDKVHYKLNPRHAKNDDMVVYWIESLPE